MNYRDYFLPHAATIDKFLAKFFKQKIRQAKEVTPVAAGMWQHFQNFIAGGKRIRGGLVKLGYECVKKVEEEKIVPVSAAIEITNAAILIHDDMIDESDLRHGRTTVHREYQKYHKVHYKKGNFLHYGESMAIMAGDMGFYEAIDLIEKSKFPVRLRLQVIEELASFMVKTVYGESLDIDLAYREKIKEKEITIMNTLKTAYYTFVGPLKIGGILAGASDKQLKRFEDYGLLVGIAFQLQDDILGMFGEEKKTGKPVDDDIKEGKNTLLFTQALKRGTPGQKKKLQFLWGNKNITLKEVEEAREIIRATGSLNYSREMTQKLVEKGKKAVSRITENTDLQEVFLTLADFAAGREK